MPGSEAFALEGVSKRYGALRALDEVSFGVREGEAVGYLGPNGAGKTTTLKLLSGLTRPSSGKLHLGGIDPVKDRARALAHVGVLVETPGVLPYLRGADLLEHIAEVKGIARHERGGAVARAAKLLDVQEPLDRPLGSLSTGLLRRVLLAGALVGDPKILVLDEPTMGLDPAARADLRGVLKEQRKAGRTIFLSTHLLEDVEEVCERVLFLRSGRLRGDEPVRGEGTETGAARPRTVRLRTLGGIAAPDLPAIQALLGARARLAPRWSEGSGGPGDGEGGTKGAAKGPASPPATGNGEADEYLVSFEGDERMQADLLRTLVAGGVRVSRWETTRSDLASLYLQKVGREEAT